MKKLVTGSCIAVAVACIAIAAVLLLTLGSRAGELQKLSLDDASAVALQIQADSEVKVEGKASIRITTPGPVTVCLAEVKDLKEIDDARVVYRAKVKCRELQGKAYLEMWCHFGDKAYFSKGLQSAVAGSMDWKTLETPFFLKKGENPDRITLNLVITGKGAVWIDDIVLSKEKLK